MRYSLLTTILSCFIALPAFAWPPEDFSIPQSQLERHLEELGIQGEAANDVRAAWGRLEFNVKSARAAGDRFWNWLYLKGPGNYRLVGTGADIEEMRSRWSQQYEQRFNAAQVELCNEYFEALSSSSPRDDDIDQLQARHYIRTLLDARQIVSAAGPDLGLVALWRQFADENNGETFPDFAHLANAVQVAFRSYEPRLADLLIERMHVDDERSEQIGRFDLANDELPEDEQAWIEGLTDARARSATIAWEIRRLNQRTVQHLATLLPASVAKAFRHRAERMLYASIWIELEYEQWISHALESASVDETISQSVRALADRLTYERSELAAELVQLQEAAESPRAHRAFYRSIAESRLERMRTGEQLNIEYPPEMVAYHEALPRLNEFGAQALERVKRTLGPAVSVVQARLDTEARAATEREREETRRRTDEMEILPRWFLPIISTVEFEDFLLNTGLLNDERKSILQQLHGDLVRALESARRAHEDRIESARKRREEARGPMPWHQLNADWNRIRTDLERTFMDDVRLLLTEDESAAWDQVVRRRRRARTLPAVGLQVRERAHHLVDLIDVIEIAGIENNLDEDGLAAVDSWSLNLDMALRYFEDRWDDESAKWTRQLRETLDPEVRRRVEERYYSDLLHIRDLVDNAHLQGADAIRAALDADQLRRFDRAVNEAVYPWVFADSPVDLIIEGLRRYELFDRHTDKLTETVERYEIERDNSHTDMVTFLRRFDFVDWSEHADEYDQYVERFWRIMLRRLHIEQRATQEIAALFPPESRDSLALDTRLLIEIVGESSN